MASDFTIIAPPRDGRIPMSFRDTSVHTKVDGGAASAKVVVEKGVVNPAYVLSCGQIPPMTLFDRTKERNVNAADGPVRDAIKALHELAAPKGVTGVQLNDYGTPGMFRYTDTNGSWVGGGDYAKRLTTAEKDGIDAAARGVFEVLGVKP